MAVGLVVMQSGTCGSRDNSSKGTSGNQGGGIEWQNAVILNP